MKGIMGAFPFETPRPRGKQKNHLELTNGPWSFEEHKQFQLALEKFGQTPLASVWEEIASHVPSRSIREVYNHAHEYFVKLQASSKNLIHSTTFNELEIHPWSVQENKVFEEGLGAYGEEVMDRWERIAAMLPGRSAEGVKKHYLQLLFDLGTIQNGMDTETYSTAGDKIVTKSKKSKMIKSNSTNQNFIQNDATRVNHLQSGQNGNPATVNSNNEHLHFQNDFNIPSLLTPVLTGKSVSKKSQNSLNQPQLESEVDMLSFPSPLNISSMSSSSNTLFDF